MFTTLVGAATFFSFRYKEENDLKELRKIYSGGDVSKWPAPNIDPSVRPTFKDIGPLDSIPYPADNPTNDAKQDLGKTLFFDPRLSSSGQIACASCHDPQLGWGDGKSVAFGHDRKVGRRNAMTLFNTAYYKFLFWDGRAKSLEDQAQFPIKDNLEMHQDLKELTVRAKKYKGYELLFEKAFGAKEISLDKVFKAIATFERTIVSPPSRFDLFVGGRSEALKDNELNGMHLFRTKARCVNCHNSGFFSDNQFHNDGQTLWGSEGEDLGRYNVTKNKADIGLFKTPSLREVANTGPWMHHGNFPSLKDVVQFYNLGNPSPIQKKYQGTARDSLLPTPSPLLKRLNLSVTEIEDIIAFLQSITTTPRRVKPPVQFPQ